MNRAQRRRQQRRGIRPRVDAVCGSCDGLVRVGPSGVPPRQCPWCLTWFEGVHVSVRFGR